MGGRPIQNQTLIPNQTLHFSGQNQTLPLCFSKRSFFLRIRFQIKIKPCHTIFQIKIKPCHTFFLSNRLYFSSFQTKIKPCHHLFF